MMNDTVCVATRKGLFRIGRRPGGGWEILDVHFLGEPVTMCLPDPRDRALYAVLTLGHFGCKLRRLSAGGADWEELPVPVYPSDALVPPHPMAAGPDAQPVPASLKEIWSLEAGGRPGELWAGTIPGGLFHSEDSGASWSLVKALWDAPERQQWFGGGKDEPGLHSICVNPRDPRHVTVAVSCGGVWNTRDGGGSWTLLGQGLRAAFMPAEMVYQQSIQDAHRLAHCAAAPDRMWIQHHNGVFHSRDAGATWTELPEIEPATFGFACCVHPQDGETAWFVPGVKDECRVPVDGRLVVTRTRDGGASFEILSRGLPQRHSYDLVLRHALDVDATGRLLAMGSTTGGLWISENGGEDWLEVSHTLPPIYCVRWVPYEKSSP